MRAVRLLKEKSYARGFWGKPEPDDGWEKRNAIRIGCIIRLLRPNEPIAMNNLQQKPEVDAFGNSNIPEEAL
jgi:hypothetical protein